MTMSRSHTRLTAALLLAAAAFAGCGSGTDLLAYIGGGLPPGEPDLGGVVLADAPVAAATAALTPVEGALVELYRGQTKVGSTLTGDQGYFRFQSPDTGQYRIRVTPPQGSHLQPAERQVSHQFGRQTYVEIVLDTTP